MEGDFFVMLTTQSGGYTPLMDKEGKDIAKFTSKDAAGDAARSCILGDAFGFEVFERGCGV